MTVRDIASLAGISVQAVYKKLSTSGLKLDELRSKETGHFTDAGLKEVERILNLNSTKVENFSTEVERLTTEVERLKEVETRLTTLVETLKDERDHLREENRALLVLQQETLRKIPAALPPAERKKFCWPWQKK